MRVVFSFLALFVASLTFAQETCPALLHDSNDNSSVEIADVLSILSFFGASVENEACPLLHDSNDNGTIDISDILSILSLFGVSDSDDDGLWDNADDCTDTFAANYIGDQGTCAYCASLNDLNSSPEEGITIGSGLSNNHMNVGTDACNGITASLGVVERYVGNVEPQSGNLTNYQVNNGYADVPEGAEPGARWNYLLSVNLGGHAVEDVDVKFGLDFDPSDNFDASNLDGSYTIFGSFSEAFAFVQTGTGIDYAQASIFQDSQNFDFGFWSELASAADVAFDPNAVGVYNVGVYVYTLEGALLTFSEISVEVIQDSE